MLLILLSCKKEVAFTEIDHAIIGNWINLNYLDENTLEMDKANTLKKNEFGYTFKGDGSIISRSNAGFCGTPPIITNDYNGTWTRVDSTLFIQVDFWGGQAMHRWKILSITSSRMKIVVEFENHNYRTK